MPDAKAAAAYIRVSTDDQTEYSPDAQRRAIFTWAANNGYIISEEHIYTDEGISGRSADRRPAFMRMISCAKGYSKPFEAILVHRFDRFARSREDSVVYKSLLRRECGVRVISVTESVEDDKFSLILEAMLEAMAEYYSINLGEEVKKGMTEKHLRGENQTSPPFGYTVFDGQLVVSADEAAFVRAVFEKFVSGDSYHNIAQWLNAAGVKTRRGNRFEARAVKYILGNPAYSGKLRWNPVRRSRAADDPGTVVVTGRHEAIIDDELWRLAQKRIGDAARDARPKAKSSGVHDWLSGLVCCCECGETMVFVKPHYRKCNGYAHGRCRHSQHVADEKLKEALLSRLRRDLMHRHGITYKTLDIGKKRNEEGALKRSLGQTDRRLHRAQTAMLDGTLKPDEYLEIKSKLQCEAEGIKNALAALGASPDGKDTQAGILRDLSDPASILCGDTPEDMKRRAALGIIAGCVWSRDKNLLRITYRLDSLA